MLWIAALAMAVLAPAVNAQPKKTIDHAGQLPYGSYPLAKPPSVLLHDAAGLAALADSVRVDLEAELAAYEIRDPAILRSYYQALSTIAMIRNRPDEAVAHDDKAGALEVNPAKRMLSGMTLRPLIAAEKADSAKAAAAFSTAFASELTRMPYDSVRADLKTARERLEMLSPAFFDTVVSRSFGPHGQSGRISKGLAMLLLTSGLSQRLMPYRDEMIRQVSALIDSHEAN